MTLIGNHIAGALTVVVAAFTRINPLWLFAAGGILGLSGWLQGTTGGRQSGVWRQCFRLARKLC